MYYLLAQAAAAITPTATATGTAAAAVPSATASGTADAAQAAAEAVGLAAAAEPSVFEELMKSGAMGYINDGGLFDAHRSCSSAYSRSA